MNKNFFASSITIILLFIGIYTALRQTKKDDNTLIIGMMSGWAPFMSITANGSYEGFDVDIAQEVAKRMNKKLIIQDLGSLASCFMGLEQNKIDMLFSGLNITEKRLERYNMIYYTGDDVTSYDLVFWKEIPQGVSSIQDIKNCYNRTVIVEPGNSSEKYIEQFDCIIPKKISTLTDQLMDLQYGKSIAIFVEPSVSRMICSKNPQFKTLPVPLPPTFCYYGMGIALKKNATVLTQQVQQIIDDMIADGTIKKLETQWCLRDTNEL